MKKDTVLLVPVNGKIEAKNCKSHTQIAELIDADWLATAPCFINGIRFTVFCDDSALIGDEMAVPTIYRKRGEPVLFGSCILTQIDETYLGSEMLTLPDDIMDIIDQNILMTFDWDGKQFIEHEVLVID